MKPSITNRPSLLPNRVELVEVEYHLTAEDYTAWQLHAWEKSVTRLSRSVGSWFVYLTRQLVLALIALILAAIGLLTALEIFKSGSLKKEHLSILAGAFLLLILLVVLKWGVGPKSFARRLARREAMRQIQARTKQMPEQNQKVILTTDKVIEITQQNQVEICFAVHGKQETVLEWTFIDSIDLAGRHVFFITESNRALIVPQRAFADERAFLDFVETAWAFHRRARENSPAAPSASPSPPQADRPEERITTRSDNRIMEEKDRRQDGS